MYLKYHNLKGIDSRNNPLNGDKSKASSIVNMVKDSSGDYVKRPGADEYCGPLPDNVVDLVTYVRGQELLAFTPSGVYKLPSMTKIPWASDSEPDWWDVKVSTCEISGVLYISDPTGERELHKYDGYMIYRAGVLPITSMTAVTDVGGGSSRSYYRAFLKHIDGQGNIVTGEFAMVRNPTADQLNSYDVNLEVSVPGHNEGQFDQKFITFNYSAGTNRTATTTAVDQVLNSGNAVLNVLAGHTIQVGNYVLVGSDPQYPARVTAIGATTLTLDLTHVLFSVSSVTVLASTVLVFNSQAQTYVDAVSNVISCSSHNYVANDYLYFHTSKGSVGCLVTAVTGTSVTINPAPLVALVSYYIIPRDQRGNSNDSHFTNTKVTFYKSSDEFFDYVKRPEFFFRTPNDVFRLSGFLTIGSEISMESEYDTSLVRNLPPKGKFLCVHNTVLVIAGKQFLDRSNVSDAQFSSPADVNYNATNSIYWSMPNTSIGYSVENFPSFNSAIIGNTNEGEITGIASDSDRLVICKEKETYYGSGDFLSGNIKFRSANTNGIGLSFHKAILPIAGALAMVTNRGLYELSKASAPEEISDDVEPIFQGLDLSSAQIINDAKNEKIYIFADDTIVVYDYYYKEWETFEGLDFSGGAAVLAQTVYFSDGDKVYFFNPSKLSDDYSGGVKAIESLYRLRFQDGDQPALKKKFIGLIFYKMGTEAFSLTIKTYKNWLLSQIYENLSLEITDDQSYYEKTLKFDQNRSLAVEFSNNVINEQLRISGFELEVEGSQFKAKKAPNEI